MSSFGAFWKIWHNIRHNYFVSKKDDIQLRWPHRYGKISSHLLYRRQEGYLTTLGIIWFLDWQARVSENKLVWITHVKILGKTDPQVWATEIIPTECITPTCLTHMMDYYKSPYNNAFYNKLCKMMIHSCIAYPDHSDLIMQRMRVTFPYGKALFPPSVIHVK